MITQLKAHIDDLVNRTGPPAHFRTAVPAQA
jgi:hypothetical protein